MALNGIDISAYQSSLDCSKVSADFIIVKATQGTSYVSSCADSQIQSTLASGKLMGFYHFADGGSATAEADYFISQCKGYFGEGIPVLDFEVSVSNPVSWCKTWLDRVTSKTGVKPVIYMNKSTAQAHDWSSVAKDYALWGAMYADSSQTAYQSTPYDSGTAWGAWGDEITIRQYSENGRVSGYSGALDLNIAYLTAPGWRAISSGGQTVSAESILEGENEMVCYFEVSGQGWPMMYFDGRTIRPMNSDQFSVIKALYKTANGGKDMPGRKITKAEYTALKKLCEDGASTYK